MKIRVIVKGIINYIFAMVFSIIFGLFLDANVGWFILLTLILAPVISVLFAWISSRLISVTCRMEDALLAKGDTCSMSMSVHNKSIFPSPPLLVNLTNEVGVRSESKSLLVSVLPRETKDFEVIFKAKLCGRSVVGIKELRVTDYLGLFSFAVKDFRGKRSSASDLDYTFLQRKVAVIPDIAEISARDDNLVKVMQTSLHMDDSDDTVEASAYSFGGFPGYDNRDYVPGDPLRRINWKQSAKRDRLLVRLDDEMASKSVNVVLDSVFHKSAVDVPVIAHLQQYRKCAEDEIIPKIAEDAVENALGIMRVLVRHSYTVNFYVMMGKQFSYYEILDESDLEAVRTELANYSFGDGEDVARIPADDLTFKEKVGIFSTPNSYEDACEVLDSDEDLFTTVYAVVEEAKKQGSDDSLISLENWKKEPEVKQNIGKRILNFVKPMIVPYLLALLLSISVFTVFEIPVISYWTLVQVLACAAVMVFCEYVNRHRITGTLLAIVLVMGDLFLAARFAFGRGYGLSYMHWFISGGESVKSTFPYLMTLVLIFTAFFAAVVYYFIRVLYRTSFLMLVSLLPFVLYVKVMQEVNMVQVVFITILNIVAFMVNTRTRRDKGKTVVGYVPGLISVGMYVTILIMMGLSLPETETRYYYLFESVFLGGNVSEAVPEEYSEMSEYSGNADGFNELNNRKLYELSSVESGTELYLKRQTFDLYDFQNDRWYDMDYYAEAAYSQEEWLAERGNMNLSLLSQAMKSVEEYEPGLLAKYGLQKIPEVPQDTKNFIYIETMNFPSVAYITPPYSTKVTVYKSDNNDQENTYVSRGGVFQCTDGFLYEDIEYSVEYFDESDAQISWIAAGGANYDSETSLQMLKEIKAVLNANNETEYAKVAELYIAEAEAAQVYKEACEENNELIPESIKELAQEITEDCTYDWQKAAALQNYFRKNDFVYDLSYDAPDDSVEYFLFEGKTGTCSDYASAYVLMARAVGLTVRYAEGFVPKEEYTGEFVVRTNCGHAYPEVYIPNVGYVVYEATLPARYGQSNRFGNDIMAYFVTALIRVLIIITFVSAVVIAMLFVHKIAAPYVAEAYFLKKVDKAMPHKAVVMLYRRIQKKHAKKIMEKGSTGMLTPYEYAGEFERLTNYDISELVYMVEMAVYAEKNININDKVKARQIYQGAKAAVNDLKTWRGEIKIL